MFMEFLKQYIKDYIECYNDKYELDDFDISKIAKRLNNNDEIWIFMDDCVKELLEEYKKEEKNEDL